MKKNKPLKVGFDLDGVILYNPARIARPFISWLKDKKIIGRKKSEFFIPKTRFQQWLWYLFHKSSIFVAPGLPEIKDLVDRGLIEAYIITARFNHLKHDFEKWLNKAEVKNIFKQSFLNELNEQPYLFKKKMIEKLDLDLFVEDNWDIVNFLDNKVKWPKKKPKIFWIYNFFDQKILHQHKFPSLSSAIQAIKKIL